MSLVEAMEIVGGLIAALAFAHGALTLIAVLVWRESSSQAPQALPPVTVLKPLHGRDVCMDEALRGLCQQDYPEYQIVFGVRDAHDPALEVVARLRREFPRLPITVAVDPAIHGANYKVSNLINMLPAAKHDYLVLADSDIHVGKDYLSSVVPPLLDPAVGIVTCAYRGRPQSNLWSRLGALYIDDWFMPSVLLAHLLGRRGLAFGATIALRRQVLEDIGGFPAIVNHLADDCMLSILTRRLGLKTVLSPYVVETTVNEPAFAALSQHELRWLRTNRFLEPVGYAFCFLTLTVPLALLGAVLAQGSALSLGLLVGSVVTRLMLHFVQRQRGRRTLFSEMWLLPLRDGLTGVMWAAGFVSRQVDWGHHHFDVRRDGSFSEVTLDRNDSFGEFSQDKD